MNTKTIYIILGVIGVGLLFYYFSNTSRSVVNENELVTDDTISEDQSLIEDLSDEIFGLKGQIGNLTKKLGEKNTEPEAPVKTQEYRIYTNDKFGISFEYPLVYEIEVNEASPTFRLAQLQVSLVDGDSRMSVLVDPEGFGPIYANIKYYLSYDYGQLEIVNKITQPCSYCDGEKRDMITSSIQTNRDSYFFSASWPRSGGSREQDIKNIIESFRFW